MTYHSANTNKSVIFYAWRKDKKGNGGGGILIMVQEDIFVEGVQHGDGLVEVIGVTIQTNGRERRKIILMCMPAKTNT